MIRLVAALSAVLTLSAWPALAQEPGDTLADLLRRNSLRAGNETTEFYDDRSTVKPVVADTQTEEAVQAASESELNAI